jgi:hypothetical protein
LYWFAERSYKLALVLIQTGDLSQASKVATDCLKLARKARQMDPADIDIARLTVKARDLDHLMSKGLLKTVPTDKN